MDEMTEREEYLEYLITDHFLDKEGQFLCLQDGEDCDFCSVKGLCDEAQKIIEEAEAAARRAEQERKRDIQYEVIAAVLDERRRQDEKWGEQNHLPQFWTGILGEEHGELCQAINETVFDNGKEERKKGGYANMREEAIHVAAVAVGFLECLERNKGVWKV